MQSLLLSCMPLSLVPHDTHVACMNAAGDHHAKQGINNCLLV